jgi:two-component system OmpR family response regulator
LIKGASGGIVSAMHSNVLTVFDPRRAPRVLLLEHTAPAGALIAAGLRDAGMEVVVTRWDAEQAAPHNGFHPDIILLDMPMAGPAGFQRIERIAEDGTCGIIVLLGSDAEQFRVESLDRGADDVLVRPVPLRELAARVRAVWRRLARAPRDIPAIGHGQVMLDVARRCLLGARGEITPLSEAEFVALETLLDADGAPVSRDWLGRVALRRPMHSEDRSVDQLVLKLRRKLSATGATDRTILSARRQGYVIPDPSRFRTIARMAAPLARAGQMAGD